MTRINLRIGLLQRAKVNRCIVVNFPDAEHNPLIHFRHVHFEDSRNGNSFTLIVISSHSGLLVLRSGFIDSYTYLGYHNVEQTLAVET
jgi:hypothetical protein